jgi:hypothetical protein
MDRLERLHLTDAKLQFALERLIDDLMRQLGAR